MIAAEAALAAARRAGTMITTAESCTGGLVAGALTAIPGSSDAVDSGFVTYSNAAKARLGVDPAVIEAHGAVSEAVARGLALAARGRALVDAPEGEKRVAVAVTGVAGPGGGTAAKPVGLVHFAATDGMRTLHAVERFGDIGRDAVRAASVRRALALLIDVLG
ncbi:CinA family protein [Acuticoccus sp. 2012]|uniref:CinA family protein n=2 Tax=Acuticoccus mangrovi TaxID=2796142 RepID=A0A934MJ68_9HYPH|nr:CinA family protein [Acuticoccus mangrovi]